MDKWDKRFMDLAETVAEWSSCYQQNRHVGAVVVKDKRILTTGYNGAPSGIESCAERGECLRRVKNIASGTMQEVCQKQATFQFQILPRQQVFQAWGILPKCLKINTTYPLPTTAESGATTTIPLMK